MLDLAISPNAGRTHSKSKKVDVEGVDKIGRGGSGGIRGSFIGVVKSKSLCVPLLFLVCFRQGIYCICQGLVGCRKLLS